MIAAAALACALAASAPAGEHYAYLAAPTGGSGRAETHSVSVDTTAGGVAYRFRVEHGEESETGAVLTTREGDFLTAWRDLRRGSEWFESDSLWTDGETVFARRRRGDDVSTKRIKVPRDRALAVDASLLMWMRGFPYDAETRLEVFMVDWSGRTVNVDVRRVGVETVESPAGAFECHRMEVVVKVLFFRPRITFWITTDPPHFLVQHRGKRGPFTPTFVTTLERVGPGDPKN